MSRTSSACAPRARLGHRRAPSPRAARTTTSPSSPSRCAPSSRLPAPPAVRGPPARARTAAPGRGRSRKIRAEPGRLLAAGLAALEHDDLLPALLQLVRGGQPADPRADHDRVTPGYRAEVRTERLIDAPLADGGPRAVRGAERRSGGDAPLPAPLSREQSDAFADRIEAQLSERARLGPVGAGGARRRVHRLHRPARPSLRGALHARGRDRLAARPRAPGATATRPRPPAPPSAFALRRRCSSTSSSPSRRPRNTRSRAVMERIGMTRDPADDFDHPSLPDGPRAAPARALPSS